MVRSKWTIYKKKKINKIKILYTGLRILPKHYICGREWEIDIARPPMDDKCEVFMAHCSILSCHTRTHTHTRCHFSYRCTYIYKYDSYFFSSYIRPTYNRCIYDLRSLSSLAAHHHRAYIPYQILYGLYDAHSHIAHQDYYIAYG